MANEQNLISVEELNSRRTPEQHSADSANGGKVSGETRRLRAAVKRALQGAIPSEMSELRAYLEKSGVDITNDNGIAFAMVLKALSGDKSAADWVRDTSGEKPKDEVDISGGAVIIVEDELLE